MRDDSFEPVAPTTVADPARSQLQRSATRPPDDGRERLLERDSCSANRLAEFDDDRRFVDDSSDSVDERLDDPLSESLLAGYRVLMRRWCRNQVRGPLAARADTSDVVQESLVQVWTDWSRVRGRSPIEIRAWLYRIAQGHLSKLRRHHAAAKRSLVRQADESGEAFEPTIFDHDSARTAERRLLLSIALESLPADLNEVIRLRLFCDLSFREIGERLGCESAEARARFLRALRRIRQALPSSERES